MTCSRSGMQKREQNSRIFQEVDLLYEKFIEGERGFVMAQNAFLG